ncbi:cell division protein ZipA C-terminal FtsZ-binding domain-containing protein [Caedibacter taeniospiralis]|jgi:FtsZ-interacting cell division protein ZipA|uniref:cell division protein ZipA C-terminal FtsZ-binding domain-containing protein n=1 Tax=Caedibacter taeniospiralis TaxID=28907 RepID=UPI0037C0EB21
MTKVQLILLLSIIIVVLLLIDAFRRSKRKKYQRKMAELQALKEQERTAKKSSGIHKQTKQNIHAEPATNKIELDEDIKVDPQANILISDLETAETTYPQLENGLVTYYISAPRGYVFNGGDLDTLFKHNGLSYNAEAQSFELLTQDKDVLFSIKADAPVEGFNSENLHQTDYTSLMCICDLTDLAQFYDPLVCFEHFSQSIDKINARLGGTLLNEHKRRFTSHDESAYKSQLKKFENK